MRDKSKSMDSIVDKILNETIQEKAEKIASSLESKLNEMDKEVCEECGIGQMNEGECNECGWKKYSMEEDIDILDIEDDMYDDEDGMYDDENEDDSDPLNYTERYCNKNSDEYNSERCSYFENNFKKLANRPFSKFEMNEKLYGNQGRLDHNKNGRIDSEDLRMARAKKGEQKEGKKFPDLTGDNKVTYADILKGRGVKLKKENIEEEEKFIQKAVSKMKKKGTEGEFKKYCGGEVTMACIKKGLNSDNPKIVKMANFAKNIKAYKGAEHKESITMTESEMINFIEKIVKEEKLKSLGKTKGLNVYEKSHRGSGKENDDYLKSVAKKMKDYLKDTSKGDYETNPDFFPKGNGELGDMKKKAYIPSDAIKDYVDNLTAAGLENLDYDEIHPNEDWVSDNIEGSSRTGNNPKWANTGKSNVNKKRNEIRKKNMLAKIKRKAYNKSPQPVVTDETGDTGTGKLMMKLESTEDKNVNKLHEEFSKMKNLITYNKKTQ